MKIIFFGTSDFAVCALAALVKSRHQILKVVTAADKKKGRGRMLSPSPVKLFAEQRGLGILQPLDLRDKGFSEALRKETADIFVVVDYGKILIKEILQIPKKYAINLHASLLPKYRGAAPVNWAIIRGERQTGITVIKMNEYIDKGEVILQRKIAISANDTSISLKKRLAGLGAGALVEALELIEAGQESFTRQKESLASSAPKLKKADGLIDWQAPAAKIHNKVRGLVPWPGAFTYLGNKLFKVWQSEVVPGKTEAKPATVIDLNEQRGDTHPDW